MSPHNSDRLEMLRAVHSRNVNEARQLLQQGFGVDQVVDRGETALQIAVWRGHLEMVQLLMDHKADVHRACPCIRETPLHIAANEGHLEVVKYLVEHGGADINREDYKKITPAGKAASVGNLQVLQYLVGQPHINKKSEGFQYLLHSACTGNRHLDVIQWLVGLQPGAVKRSDRFGNFPLHLACRGAAERLSVEVIQYLMKCFPDAIHHRNDVGNSPLKSLLDFGWGALRGPQSSLQWLELEPDRTILSLKQLQDDDNDWEAANVQANWDHIVALLWCYYFGCEEGPPRIANTKRLSNQGFKDAYKWMIHAACALIHMDGRLLEQFCHVYESNLALEKSEHTGKTPLLAALQAAQRHLKAGAHDSALESRFTTLIQWNPIACRIRDNNNRIPVAYAIEAGLSRPVIDSMVRAWPASVLEKDINGFYMFELAACGDLSTVYSLSRSGALVHRIKDAGSGI